MIMHSICIHIYWEKKRGIWKIVYLKQLEHTKLQRLAPARSSQPVTVYRKNHYMCFYRRILHESNPSLVEHKIPAILQYVPNGQASQVQCFYHNSVGHPRQFVFWYLDTGKQEMIEILRYSVAANICVHMQSHCIEYVLQWQCVQRKTK